MKQIEALLQKSTQMGGFDKLPKEDADILASLSLLAEQFEDNIPLMPIKTPSTLTEMIRYKMFEMNLKQKQLAKILEISEARISEILTGKRKINIELAKKLHSKLNIDAHFILELA
jgi:HTH-type transcriptional regulator/antitoxin HigA